MVALAIHAHYCFAECFRISRGARHQLFPTALVRRSANAASAAASDFRVAPTQPNTVDCFDYYHFGSVQVDVTPSVASAVSGVPITFTGKIKNANPYPIVDGSVYVKIFRQRGNGEKDVNGPDVVDQFYAAEGLTISANGELPISINWNIPSYAVSGEYKMATFFTVSHKFNLLGLPFTDDVVGNTASFKVAGELKNGVSFKKDAVTVGGEKYYFAAFPPRTSATDPVTVETTLTNPTGESVGARHLVALSLERQRQRQFHHLKDRSGHHRVGQDGEGVVRGG